MAESTLLCLELFPERLPSQKTSAVWLDATDYEGNTAVHHLVRPLEFGTFNNTTLLKILHDAGASLTIKNADGKTPLDLALECCAKKLAQGIQSLLGVPESQWVNFVKMNLSISCVSAVLSART